ncbi:uncharacterized protein LOC125963807 [Orcinus orca]|uniref:uncharacterized protein LOC125963807 n=1 Tax=Orcinus orca TaxID=9733 RepID=UPI002112DD0F|nr:uncharacterized protein LOC125963807 [Orcinus orca]
MWSCLSPACIQPVHGCRDGEHAEMVWPPAAHHLASPSVTLPTSVILTNSSIGEDGGREAEKRKKKEREREKKRRRRGEEKKEEEGEEEEQEGDGDGEEEERKRNLGFQE